MAAPPWRLRPARPGDEGFLLDLFCLNRAGELALFAWSQAQSDLFLRSQFQFREQHYQRQFPEAASDLVLVGEALAGRILIHPGPEADHLVDIALLPAFQGQGLGTELLAWILRQAEGAGRAVTLQVEAGNLARRLYERLGFQTQNTDGVYVGMRHAAVGGQAADESEGTKRLEKCQ